MLRKILPICLVLAVAGCGPDTEAGKSPDGGGQQEVLKTWNPPPAGTIVDKAEERITEDRLNEQYFRVTVTSTETSKEGSFLLKLEYGFNINETTVDLPKWTKGVVLKPVLKKGAGHYHGLLGFDTGNGQFRELYDISVKNGNVVLKQTKGYYPVSK